MTGTLAVVPFIASAFLSVRATAAAGATSVVTGTALLFVDDVEWGAGAVRLAALAAAAVFALPVARSRIDRERRLVDVSRVAEAVQQAVLRPLPRQVGWISADIAYVSASEEALVGGDFYEVLETPFGVRGIVGDVRGKGIGAVRLASIVLGAFRTAAFEHPAIDDLVLQLDLAVRRFSDASDEEFVTAVLVEVAADGSVSVANCGHPPPLVLRRGNGGRVELLQPSRPSAPLGLMAGVAVDTSRLDPGDRLLCYTDGTIEARDGAGVDFDLVVAAAGCLSVETGSTCLDRLLDALHDHAGGRLSDDVAMLLMELTSAA